MIEGKLDPEDAISQACDLLSAGLDTVGDTLMILGRDVCLSNYIITSISSCFMKDPNICIAQTITSNLATYAGLQIQCFSESYGKENESWNCCSHSSEQASPD